jgi:hypothetical protein
MIIKIEDPTAEKLAKAEDALRNRKDKRKGFDAKKYLGKLKGVFGDAVTYQQTIRNEWD